VARGKRRWRSIVYLLLGMAVLLAPVVLTQIKNNEQARIAENYSQHVAQLGSSTRAEQLRRARQYNRQLQNGTIRDPWGEPPDTGSAHYRDYMSQLNLDQAMARVRVPSVGIDLPVYHGTSQRVLATGVGHLYGTALPVGGVGTHSVLTGHTGLATLTMFDNLTHVQVGDIFYVDVMGETLAYRVDRVRVVEPTDLDAIRPVKGRDYATLVTCTPYGINSHRLLVRGVRTTPPPPEPPQRYHSPWQPWMIAVLIVVLLVLVYLICWLVSRRRHDKDEDNDGPAPRRGADTTHDARAAHQRLGRHSRPRRSEEGMTMDSRRHEAQPPLVRRLVAALVAVLLTGAGTGTPMTASAASGAGSNTLVLVKRAGEGEAPGESLEGIVLQVNQVLDVNLASADELRQLVNEQPAVLTPASRHRMGPDHRAVTDSDGRARVDGLPNGVYLVRERPSRVGNVAYSVATPFLVALPNPQYHPDQKRSHTVEVALKDQPISVQIAATPSTVAPCDQVHLRLTGTAPEPDVHDKLYRYVMVTTMDPALTDRQVRRVWIDTGASTVALTRGRDWTSRVDARSHAVVIDLTESGLARLARTRSDNPRVRVEAEVVATASCQSVEGRRLTMSVGLFPDGWQPPTDLGRITDTAASTAQTSVLVAAHATPSSSVAPPAPDRPGTNSPGLVGPGLPSTGALGAAGGIGTVIVAVIAVLVVVRRRQRDKEESQ